MWTLQEDPTDGWQPGLGVDKADSEDDGLEGDKEEFQEPHPSMAEKKADLDILVLKIQRLI